MLPTLVYGSPPVARIDDGKLVHLRGPVPVRDAPAEQRALERLREELDLLPGRRTTYDGRDAPRFVEKLKRWRGDLSGERGRHRQAGGDAGAAPARRRATAPARRMPEAVRFDLTFEPARPTRRAARGRERRRRGRGRARLAGGAGARAARRRRLGVAAAGWLQKHGQRVADLLAAREADGRLARHALPALAALCAELEHPPPPGLDRLAPLVAGFERLPEAPLPADLDRHAAPLPAPGRQLAGVPAQRRAWAASSPTTWASARRCRRCASSMARARRRARPTLVVCPTSVLFNWQAELARFRPACRSPSITAPGARSTPTADVTLTSYALLRLDAKALAARSWRRSSSTRRRRSRTPTARPRAPPTRCRRRSAWR